MQDIVGFAEYDRLNVISKLEKHVLLVEDKIRTKTNTYHEKVKEYKGLSWRIKLFTANPESSGSSYYSALELFLYIETDELDRLRQQVKAFSLSTHEKVLLSSNSWIIDYLT